LLKNEIESFLISFLNTFLLKLVLVRLMSNTKNRNRLVGALGGAGGALVLTAFFNYLFYGSWWESIWLMNSSFGIIGALLIFAALTIRSKKGV
jgi:hypothetical protein